MSAPVATRPVTGAALVPVAPARQPATKEVTVCVYTGLLKYFSKSGLGEAVRHQHRMQTMLGNEVTTNPFGAADVIHLNSVLPDSFLVALLAKLRGIPVVMHAHSTEEDFRNSFIGANTLAPWFKKWIRRCYSTGDLVLTPTEYSATLLSTYGINAPVRVISNGVDTDFFAPDAAAGQRFRQRYGLSADDRVVMSAGHFFERKGLPDFVELARSAPDVRFFWFGNTDSAVWTPAVRRALANRPANLTMPGFVSQAQLRDAYCGADLFCFMTHEETEGIVMLEALATGVPVLVRDIDIYRDWLPNGIVTHQASTLAEFHSKMRGILDGTLADLQMNGRALADRYSLRNVAGQLAGHYRTLHRATPARLTAR